MSTKKNPAPGTAVMVEPDPASNPDPVTEAPRTHLVGTAPEATDGDALDPSLERDYWHVNYMTRPYYQQSRSFGDYEAAYRYGWENASKAGETTFEEAEKSRLASGWPAARGESPLSWEEAREATRDAWTRARRNRAS